MKHRSRRGRRWSSSNRWSKCLRKTTSRCQARLRSTIGFNRQRASAIQRISTSLSLLQTFLPTRSPGSHGKSFLKASTTLVISPWSSTVPLLMSKCQELGPHLALKRVNLQRRENQEGRQHQLNRNGTKTHRPRLKCRLWKPRSSNFKKTLLRRTPS